MLLEEPRHPLKVALVLVLVLVLVCVLGAATPAHAQNRGVYPLGMSATSSGLTPEAGFTYSNQLLYYSRDRAKDDDGDTLPVTGQNAVIMDMNSFVWVSGAELPGGMRFSMVATLPVARNSLTSDVAGDISGGSGFADSYYMPFILGWARERVGLRLIYGFLAPTGRFEGGANDNVGSGYWTHTVSSGQTFQLTKTGSLVLSAFEMYELHTEQEDTGTSPGDTFDMDYSLLATILGSESVQLRVGVVGYLARQTTATTGPQVSPEASRDRYAVNAAGLAATAAFPCAKASVAVKGFKEFANRSTYQGYSVQLLGAITF